MTEITGTTPLKITVRPLPENSAVNTTSSSFWNGETPSFQDILDTINPLQHIPIISNIYQSLTGDTPSQGSQIIGGALFGGAVGLLASVVNSIVENETGKNIIGNIFSVLEDGIPPMQEAKEGGYTAFLPGNQRNAYNAYVQAGRLS